MILYVGALLVPLVFAGSDLTPPQRAWLLAVSNGTVKSLAGWEEASQEQLAALATKAAAHEATFETSNVAYDGAVDHVYVDCTMAASVMYDDVGDSAIWTGSYGAAMALKWNTTRDASALKQVNSTLDFFDRCTQITPSIGYMARFAGDADDPSYQRYYNGSSTAIRGTGAYSAWVWLAQESRDQYDGSALFLSAVWSLVDDDSVRNRAGLIAERMVDRLESDDWLIVNPVPGELPELPNPLFACAWMTLALAVNPSKYAHLALWQAVWFDTAVVFEMSVSTPWASEYFTNNLMVDNMFALSLLDTNDTHVDALNSRWDDVGNGAGALHLQATFAAFSVVARHDGDTAMARGIVEGLLLDFQSDPKWERFVNSSGIPDYPRKSDTESAIAMLPSDRPFDTFMWQRGPCALFGGQNAPRLYQSVDYFLPYWAAVYAGVLPHPA